MRALVASAAALFCLCALALAAHAQAPKVYVIDTVAQGDGAASLVSERVHDALVDRLSGSPKIEILDKFKPREGGKSANAALDEAAKLYNSGIGLLVAEDFEGAAKAFQRSVELFEGNLADVEDYAILKDALLRHGIANLKAGYDLDARSALKVWVTLNPGVKLSPKDYPEDVLEIVAKERRRAKKRGEGSLKVTSSPPGAEVFLDGQSLGQTPLEKKGVAPGVHYLVVKGAGPFPSAQKINVRGKKKTEEIEVNLESASASASNKKGPLFLNVLQENLDKGNITSELNPYLQELATRSGADAITFSVLRMDKEGNFVATGFVFEARSGLLGTVEDEVFDSALANLTLNAHQLSQKLITAILDFPEDRVVTGNPFLVAAVPKEAVKPKETVKPKDPIKVEEKKDPEVVAVVPPGPGDGGGSLYDPTLELKEEGPFDPRAGVDEEEFYETWWFWTGVSAVVLSGAAGGYLLFSDNDTSNPQGFSATVTW